MLGVPVELPAAAGWVQPVNDLSLRIGVGECVGLGGESGIWKTMLSLELMGLLPAGARGALEQASVPEPETRAQQFPHQHSDALRQRAMIAMALATRPKLLIADEPTTALDVTVHKQILELLDRLRRDMHLGLLFITRNLGVVAKVADRVAAMRAGKFAEYGPAKLVLGRPESGYTQERLAAVPEIPRSSQVWYFSSGARLALRTSNSSSPFPHGGVLDGYRSFSCGPAAG